MGVDDPGPREVSKAVIRIRTQKLPDPAIVGNAGSFFKNPVVSNHVAGQLLADYPDLPVYEQGDDRCKLAAAWMIENCGWKGFCEGDAGVSKQHALVIVNHGAASGAQILALAGRIRESVNKRFGLLLEVEPQIVGPAEGLL